jgi:hypothetical protein
LWACSTHGKKRNAYKVLVGKIAAKRPLGRPKHIWKDSIEMDFNDIGLEGVE